MQWHSILAMFVILLQCSGTADSGCSKFRLEGTTQSYAGTYSLAPSFTRYNGRSAYVHEHHSDVYVFYDESGLTSGWYVVQTTLYANDSAASLEGVSQPWQENGVTNHDIKFTCIEANCQHIVVNHTSQSTHYTGVYDIRSDFVCDGHPVYLSDHYYLYYMYLSTGWRGWIVGRYSCSSSRGDFEALAYSEAYHVEAVGPGWEVYDNEGWVYDSEGWVYDSEGWAYDSGSWAYDPRVSVICQTEPEPVPVSCEWWRKSAIGLGLISASAIIFILTFLICGLDSDAFEYYWETDEESDLAWRDDMGTRATNHNYAPTFMDMAVTNNAPDWDSLEMDMDAFNSSFAPPPDYETAIRSSDMLCGYPPTRRGGHFFDI